MNKAIWMSRHNPTQEQISYLNGKGYEIYQMNTETVFTDGKHAWQVANAVAGELTENDVVVAIMPIGMVAEYLRTCGNVPLVKPEMTAIKRENGQEPVYQFKGFSLIKRVIIETENF